MELLIVIAVIGILGAIAIPSYSSYQDKIKITTCIAGIRAMEQTILLHRLKTGSLPADLSEAGLGSERDPWGNVYQYLNMSDNGANGHCRKDHNLHPLNTDFDLYSMGPDGQSSPPLTASHSRDDILRANDGNFIGEASKY